MTRIWIAAALAVSLATPVLAQGFGDSGQKQTTFRSEDAKKIDAEIDMQYKRSHDFGHGDQTTAAKDPWGGVRSSTPEAKPDVKPAAKKAAK
jgi:hypothetical protein